MGTTCTAPTPTNTVDSNMMQRRIISTGDKENVPSVIYHSKIFLEVSLYTKVTGLIINLPRLPSGDSEEDLPPAIWNYSLEYQVRYDGIEMTWTEDLNHNKPLHKA